MAIIEFPPHHSATEEGLLALGGDLEVSSLYLAYSQGIFPWPISDEFPLAWFSPNPRGVLLYSDLHISKGLKKIVAQKKYKVQFDQNFSTVIQKCAKQKRGKTHEGTWITPEIINAYINLHHAGYAHSIEILNQDNELIGGLYGVFCQGVFSGESMFFDRPNASKIALVETIRFLESNGFHWLDTQMVSPIIKSMGGKEIPREDFLNMIRQNQKCWDGKNPFQDHKKKAFHSKGP